MRETKFGINYTTKNQHIRMCIASALLELLCESALENITITQLVKTAHVSRMTFYKYYTSKQEVLRDYMYEMMNDYMKETKTRTDIGRFREQKHISHCFNFFKKYALQMKILVEANMYSVIIGTVNDYMDSYIEPESDYSKYELYYYAGAICNTYIKWIEAGMKEKPEEIANIVYGNLIR